MSVRYVVKPEPDLSANQLAEYLNAYAPRQEGILRSAKYQSRDNSAHRIRYRDARQPIARCFASNRLDFSSIHQAQGQLQKILDRQGANINPPSDFVLSDARLSIKALDSFIGAANRLPLSGLTFVLGDHRPPRIVIERVSISVRPDVIVTAMGRGLKPLAGGILMFFSHATEVEHEEKAAKREEFASLAATLVHMYATQHLALRGEPSRKHCFSYDVFAQQMHSAPTSFARREENIRASCRMIASHWPNITPPTDWKGPRP